MKKHKKYSLSETDYIINNYFNLGPQVCSEYLNRSVSSIIKKAQTLKIKLNPKFKKQVIKNPNKLNVNPNNFLHLSTIYHIYLMGYIWGDGNIYKPGHRITLQVNQTDAQSLIPLFNYTGKWCFNCYKNKISHRQNFCTFITYNTALYNFLDSLGYDEKSYISHQKVLEYIPENLQYMWLRGLIDADGCFFKGKLSTKSFSITSSYEQDWEYLISYLQYNNICLKYSRNIKKLGRNSSIYSRDYLNIHNIGKFIYPNGWDGIGLKRKYDKWLQIIHSIKCKKLLFLKF